MIQIPLILYQQNFSKWQIDFIENGHKYAPEAQSKFLRIWSNVLYSYGRFWIAKEVDWETVELQEIDIAEYMAELRAANLWVIEMLKKHPEMKEEFRKTFAN